MTGAIPDSKSLKDQLLIPLRTQSRSRLNVMQHPRYIPPLRATISDTDSFPIHVNKPYASQYTQYGTSGDFSFSPIKVKKKEKYIASIYLIIREIL